MQDDALADLIAAAYGAASGAVPWSDVKRRLCLVMEAPFSGIVIGDPQFDGRLVNILEDEFTPLPQWRVHNPFLDPARRVWAGLREKRPVVALGHEVVDDSAYVRSQYYADHGRRLEMRYEIGTTVQADDVSMTALGVYRPAHFTPFGERERGLLEAFRPHLRRALQLREALRPEWTASLTGFAVLEAIRQPVVLVDRDCRILHANRAAIAVAAAGKGLAFSSTPPRGIATGRSTVTLADRNQDAALRDVVGTVALLGGPGTAIRVGKADATRLMVAVLPVPASLLTPVGRSGTKRGLALLFVRDLGTRAAPPVHVLQDLFGLTPSEAAVAGMMARGTTAARVAATRGVSVETVRTQLRSILGKLGARNLREFEAILGRVDWL